MFDLVRASTEDKLYLGGLFTDGDKTKPAVLYIHGFQGSFYEDSFTKVIAEYLHKENRAFLTANTRGNGKDSEFNTTDGKIVRIGAHYELLKDSPKDIDAWIKFLIDQGHKEIILAGHSLGTLKVVRYLFEGKYKNNVKKLILLCPFDQAGLMIRDIKTPVNELIVKAKEKIKQGKGEEMITSDFETITMSYNTWLSWYTQDDFGRMFEFCNKDYDFPILNAIKIPTKIIVGSLDEYFTSEPNHKEGVRIMLKNIPNSEGKIIEGAQHQFHGHEDELAKEVLKFI